MEEMFPWIVLVCGLYLGIALRFPKLREAYRTRHPRGNRIEQTETMAIWMTIVGSLWAIQYLLQG